MKQSEWKNDIEFIAAEMLRLGQESAASVIMKQFGTRLSSTIQRFFTETNSFVANSPLTVEQYAFMHSLQLYDLNSVMRLVVNYDASKGLKVVLPGIEKSYRSLMVIQQLEKFTINTLESTALADYKSSLEDALSRVLKCHRKHLYEEDILAEKMVVVSGASEVMRNKFFDERLRALFSSNYRTYLLLKNRYFLNRLKHFRKTPNNFQTQKIQLTEMAAQFENYEKLSLEKLAEKLDFRLIEKLVKEQITISTEKSAVKNDSKEDVIPANIDEKDASKIDEPEKTNAVPHSLKLDENQKEAEILLESDVHENAEDSISAYEKLCATYAKPLKILSASLCPVPECSSPYFRSRVEDYRNEFATFFRKLHGDDLQVIAASQNFTLELLIQRGQEYKATERWGFVTKNKQDEDSIYFRSTKDVPTFLDRKAEWSMLIHASLPFEIQLPFEKAKNLEIEKNKLCVFQIGTAFFDQEHQNKLDEYPDVFFKLMFAGHLLTGKNAVIYVEEDPYFTTTLEQMWHCRGLVYLFLIAISHRFALEISSAMQDYLVTFLPNTLLVSGNFPVSPPLSPTLDITAVR